MLSNPTCTSFSNTFETASCGDFGNEPNLHAIAGEAPPELFNSSIFMKKIKKTVASRARHPNSKHYSWDGDHVLPPASRIDLGRSDMRELFREADEELRPGWSFAPRPMLPGLMVIDCLSRRVVTAPPGCDYVALSYVWGSITSRRGNENFQLDLHEQSLPQTVQDAMNVVRVLGMKFLWVDRYCINGTEPAMKHHMINNMDSVYAEAYMTIVAASGSDDEHGLPSVSGSCKALEGGHTPPWDGVVCTVVSPAHHEQIMQSAWSTRGWTYQEGLLSRRRLIFTDDCAILHYRGNDRVNSSMGIFSHINEYSRRSLTYPSDSLNALLGVFRAYQRLRPPAMHVWGVPFLLSSNGTVVMPGYGLLWRCHRRGRSLQRIQGLPSWTWAGWSGWSDRNADHWDINPHLYRFAPYHWLVSNSFQREGPQSWWSSDISLEILVGEQIRDISNHFRPDHRVPTGMSGEPAPILYLTAWTTTITAATLPEFSVLLKDRDMYTATATFDPTVESLCNAEPHVNGSWSLEWTAAVICWGLPGDNFNRLEAQSLLLERLGEDTFRRIGVLEADWLKSDLDEEGRIAAYGRKFTRKRLRIV